VTNYAGAPPPHTPVLARGHSAEELARRRYLEDTTWRRSQRAVKDFIRRRPLGTIGAAIIIVMLLAAAFAEIVTPYGPDEGTFTGLPEAPSFQHLLGTDAFGRDVFSRIIYGSQTALLVGFTSSLVGSTTGLVLGIIGAYFGGKIDELIQRLMDVLMSFPLIVIAIAVVAALGPGTTNVIVAITLPLIPRVARVVRASGLAVVRMPYIEAARSVGVRAPRIMFRHIAPNVFAPYLIMLTAFLGQAILLEASLSFLGLGVVEPAAAWGLMLRGQGMTFLDQAPWLAIAPGVAISLAVFGFNLFGDSLRDALDPRLRTA
jgi:peptide/nickel transport system permease protein